MVLDSDYGEQHLRGSAGEAVLYPASTLHRVQPVASGTRLVAVTWIQSVVRDSGLRRILFDLAKVASALDADESQSEHALRLRRSYHYLLRLWAEP